MAGGKIIQVTAGKRNLFTKSQPKRNQHRAYTASISRGSGLSSWLPQRKVITMNYRTSGTMSKLNNEKVGLWRIKFSNLYDPETDNLGCNGQYQGYAKIATLYNRYKVLSCKVRVRFNNAGTYVFPVAITFQNDSSSTISSQSLSLIASRKGSKSTTVGLNKSVALSARCSVQKQWGIPKYAFDDNYVGMFDNTAPARQTYLVICFGEIADAVSVAQSLIVSVDIVSKVEVFDPIEAIDP